jgi:Rer1 family
MQAVITAFFMTFFPFFDIPVFWPILLTYWLLLFFLTMRNQIAHMIKYRYVPFSWGKAKYAGKSSGGGKKKEGSGASIQDNSIGRGGGVNVERLTSISEPRFNPAHVK